MRKKSFYLSFFLCVVLTCFFGNVYAAPLGPAISISGVTIGQETVSTNDGTYGYDFTADDNYYVTALGIYNFHVVNGIGSGYKVGIWADSSTLLGSTDVPSGTAGTLIEGYRYKNLDTYIPLESGHSYRIGAFAKNGEDLVVDATVTSSLVTVGPGIKFYSYGSTLTYPSSIPDGSGDQEYMTANMLLSEVPIPPTLLLLGSALIGLIGLNRKFKKA